jgi:DNA-binding transcriptional ArsR family regulator
MTVLFEVLRILAVRPLPTYKYALIYTLMDIATETFRALADPTRRAVFERLWAAELSVSELTAGFDVSQPAISQHLAALKAAGLVVERRAGRFAYYRARPSGLESLKTWVDRYRAFWPERIEKLKDVLKDIEP